MSKKSNCLFEFDNFRADPQQKCLWFGSQLVSLTPKSFDTLLVLIKNKGKIVDKETLLNQVWGDTFVEESALKQNISILRKKLDSLQNGQRFIETIPRRGYRFVGEVQEIYDEDEILVVETRTRTHLVTNQEIHSSVENPPTGENNEKYFLAIPKLSTLLNNKSLLATSILGLIIVSISGYFAVRFFFHHEPMAEKRFSRFEMSKLTASGNIDKLTVSPDGKYIALVEKKGGSQTLSLRQINNDNKVEIIPPTKDDIFGLTFSLNSDYIYYSFYPQSDSRQRPRVGVLSKIPILGGTRTEILRDIDSPVSISPDGQKLAFIRHNSAQGQSSIIIFETTGNENKEVVLTSRSISERFHEDGVSWSPDGQKVAAVANNSKDLNKPFEVIIIDTENGHQNVLSNQPWSWMGQLAWLTDGSGIVLTALSEDSPNLTDEVWIISYPAGIERKVTNGINGFYGLGMTADSNSLVTVKSDLVSELWIIPLKQPNAAKMIQKSISNGGAFKFGMDFTANQKIVYSSAELGNADIWMMDADGSHPKQLTNNSRADLSPTASKDGRYIVYISNRSGTKNVWRMNFDGTDQTQLTDFQNVLSPSVSPDGKWVYFAGSIGKAAKYTLWKISIDGGEPESLSDLLTLLPQLSPDGKYIACFYPQNGDQANQHKPLKLTILSSIDASVVKHFEVMPNESQFAWTADSNAISHTEEINGDSVIWLQKIDGSAPEKIYISQNEKILNHYWADDGVNLIIRKGLKINDVVLIKTL